MQDMKAKIYMKKCGSKETILFCVSPNYPIDQVVLLEEGDIISCEFGGFVCYREGYYQISIANPFSMNL